MLFFSVMSISPILNIPLANLTSSELLSQLTHGVLITPNVDQLVKLQNR